MSEENHFDQKNSINILAIETSCDETAAAVYNSQTGVLSNNLFSQIEMHKKFGGVIPEIASRSHLEKIGPIVNNALKTANKSLDDINVIAVTNKPGLPGSLLIGLSFAKAMAFAAEKKLVGVNHLEGHIFSVFLENNVPFPFICLTASGGHTALYLVKDFGEYILLGQTLDDAAGEAFDKIAKLMNLNYPGGPEIEKLAEEIEFQDFFNYPRAMSNSYDFSFSGLKTAVLYSLVKQNAYDLKLKKFLKETDYDLKKQVASSLLVCIADIFQDKLKLCFKEHPNIKSVAFVGGVACNNFIRNKLKNFLEKQNKLFFYPSKQYCTDNAAMIAFVANYKARKNQFSNWELDIY